MLLAEKLKAYRLILASASPRRRQLLVGCGLPFVQAEPYDVSETYPAGMPAGEVPVYLARLKSDAYPLPLASFDILVTADTVVAVDDRILGKPADRGVAVAMLRALSGRRHRVVTGVTIRTADRAVSFSSSTDVFSGLCPTRKSAIMSTRTLPMTRLARTAFRSGSAMSGSSVSKDRSTT